MQFDDTVSPILAYLLGSLTFPTEIFIIPELFAQASTYLGLIP